MDLIVLILCSILILTGIFLIIFNKVLFSKKTREFYLRFANKKWILIDYIGGALALIIAISLADFKIGSKIILMIITLITLGILFYIQINYLKKARKNIEGLSEKIGRIISIVLGFSYIILGVIIIFKEGI